MPITFVIFLILMYLINIVEMYTKVFNAFDHSQFPNNLYTTPYNASKFHFDWVKISSLPTFALFFLQFFIILNVAVGGVGFFPDKFRNSPYPKPWNDKSEFTARDFWNHKSQWYPTWNPYQNDGEQAAMQVDYIRVWKMKP